MDCIIPCVNYDDFLDITLQFNRRHFDTIMVVSTDDDKDTRKCCYKHKVLCLCTDSWFSDGARFNKGKALNAALALFREANWICSMDADIVLPDSFGYQTNVLDPANLYSAERRMCDTERGFDTFLATRDFERFKPYYDSQMMMSDNYLLGYLQIWCQGVQRVRFPEVYDNAAMYDLAFANNWEIENRLMIPGMAVLHLGDPKRNWDGRISDRWGSK